ncbi:MAG: type fimbrial biosis protein FimT [Pseudomonadota bacterium]|nr:type fimbrial biosis protein FimT [Pseudomonadota bacterium]
MMVCAPVVHLQKGFTLLELIVTLAVAAIVLTMGVPSFQALIRNSRLVTLTNEFIGAMHLTRSEAIKRNHRVTLCRSADGRECTDSGGYEQGWIVFDDHLDLDTVVETGETVIRVFQGASTGMTLRGNTPVQKYVSYDALGFSRLAGGGFQAGSLTVCHAPDARYIILNSVGRVRTASSRPPNTSPPSCPP